MADSSDEGQIGSSWALGVLLSLLNVWIVLLLGSIRRDLGSAIAIPLRDGTFYIFATVLVVLSATALAADRHMLRRRHQRHSRVLLRVGTAIEFVSLVIFTVVTWERLSGRGGNPHYDQPMVQGFGASLAVVACAYGFLCERLRRGIRRVTLG
jgi:hypothetical protein